MTEHDDLSRLHADLNALRDELRKQGLLSAVLDQRLKAVETDVEKIVTHAENYYVPLVRYLPVEKAVIGTIALICVSFVGALVALVLR